MSTRWVTGMEKQYGPSPYTRENTEWGTLTIVKVGVCAARTLWDDPPCHACGQRQRRAACPFDLWLVRFGTTFEVVKGCQHRVRQRYEKRFAVFAQPDWSMRVATGDELRTLAQWTAMEAAARSVAKARKAERESALLNALAGVA